MTYPLVKVVWIDTVETSDCSWQSKEERLEETPASIDSVGYLIKQNDDYIVLAADKATEDEDDLYGRCQVIPKGVVKRMENIST